MQECSIPGLGKEPFYGGLELSAQLPQVSADYVLQFHPFQVTPDPTLMFRQPLTHQEICKAELLLATLSPSDCLLLQISIPMPAESSQRIFVC